MTKIMNSKPTGVQKGSGTMAAKHDIKSQAPSVPNPSKNKKVVAKLMKKYPNTFGVPSPEAVVSKNEQAKDFNSKAISQKNSGRSLRFIGS